MNVWIVDQDTSVVVMDLKNLVINARKGTTVPKEVKQMYQLRLIIDVLKAIIVLKEVPLLYRAHQVTSNLLCTLNVVSLIIETKHKLYYALGTLLFSQKVAICLLILNINILQNIRVNVIP